jgi:hypothetical protein
MLLILAALAASAAACAENETPAPPPAAVDTTPRPLTVTSDTMAVKGEYAGVALEQVTGLAVDNGKLAIRGEASAVTADPPAGADISRPSRRWVLVTEADVDDKRVLVFTHEESLDDFTVELPAGEAPIRFGVFERSNGGEVLVLAWGSEGRSYWGHVAIERR